MDELESQLLHLKGLDALTKARNRALEKISTAPTDLDGISKLVTELTVKTEIQSEIIAYQKDVIKQKDRIILNQKG